MVSISDADEDSVRPDERMSNVRLLIRAVRREISGDNWYRGVNIGSTSYL